MKIGTFLKLSAVALALAAVTGCSIAPQPLTHEDRKAYLEADRILQARHFIDVYGPISLSDAMARTVLSNIDYRVQMMEHAFAEGEFEKAKLEMLPKLRALGAANKRGPQSASRSVNMRTGETSTGGYTSSEEREHEMGDITFSWNLLDFGLSYYTAKQQGDAVLVRREMQRSALQELLFKVRTAYWKAFFAQEFGGKIDAALAHARKALAASQEIEKGRLQPLVQTLQYQRSLHSIISQLQNTRNEMDMATVDLRSLMNIPAGAKLKLIAPSNPDAGKMTLVLPDLHDMLDVALDQRPEARQAMYKSRASLNEVKKAFLRTLPGLEVKSAFNFDTNRYLRDHEWWNIWGGLTANIIDMVTAPKRISIARTNVDLADYRRLGVHLSIIAQVQLAARQLDMAVTASNEARELSDIDNRLFALIRRQGMSGAGSELESIRQEVTAVYSRLNLYKTFAETQNAYGRMINSLGIDLVHDLGEATDFVTLRKKFERQAHIETMDITKIIEDFKAWDAARSQKLQVTIRVPEGSVDAGTGQDATSVTLTGTPAEIAASIQELRYKPAPEKPYVFEDSYEKKEGIRPAKIDVNTDSTPVVPRDAARSTEAKSAEAKPLSEPAAGTMPAKAAESAKADGEVRATGSDTAFTMVHKLGRDYKGQSSTRVVAAMVKANPQCFKNGSASRMRADCTITAPSVEQVLSVTPADVKVAMAK